MPLDLAAIRAAHDRIRPHIYRTPVLTNARLNAACGGKLFFKCENLQKIGAFKARGAANAVFSLADAESLRGVATYSPGNHAAAVARAAKLRGIPAHIVMPSDVAKSRLRVVEGYGGKITFCDPTAAAGEEMCGRVLEQTLATLIHPCEDERVMAGQGTAVLELLEDVHDLDLLLVPVGGGGLLCGAAVAGKALRPQLQVIGAEPAGADDATRAFRAGHRVDPAPIDTIADALRPSLGEPNFALAQQTVDNIVTVSEAAIIAAMRLIWEAIKIVIEPSAAVPYAAILENKVLVANRRVAIILTGGNVELDTLPWLGAK